MLVGTYYIVMLVGDIVGYIVTLVGTYYIFMLVVYVVAHIVILVGYLFCSHQGRFPIRRSHTFREETTTQDGTFSALYQGRFPIRRSHTFREETSTQDAPI